MVKYHKIRWTEQDLAEINRTVRNFNAKINRLTKQDPKLTNILPEKVKARELKALISTRQDLKRELNALKRFSRRGAEEVIIIPDTEYNLKITKWQRTEMLRRIAFINRRRKARLDEINSLEATSRGKKLGYKIGEIGMGDINAVTLKPINAFTPSMNRADLDMKWKYIKKESQLNYFTERDYKLKETFLREIRRAYDENDIQDVIEAIENMDIKEFVKRFQEEGNDMEQAYVPQGTDYEAYVNALKSTWLPKRQKRT